MASPKLGDDVGERTVRRVIRRLLPFLFLAYVTNYLDRTNVAYAALQMSEDLNFSDRVFGLGAGMFFIGYVLLQIPATLLVERCTARRCISGIMIVWGACSVLLAFVKTPGQFYASRLLLGVAEAGFFPGIMVYLTHWIRYKDRATATAHFMVAIPISFIVGSPLAATLLRVDWLGLHGWRWIFIGEGIPAVMIGLISIVYLSEPDEAYWLTHAERTWIVTTLNDEKQLTNATQGRTSWQSLLQANFILLSLVALFSYISFYGLIFWLPTILKRLSGFPDFKVALISAVPYVAGFFAMQWCGRHSDRSGERRWHAAGSLFVSAASILIASGIRSNQWLAVAAFTGALLGFLGFLIPFWALVSELGSAASIAGVNLIGSLGGFLGPYLVGYLRTCFGSFTPPLELLFVTMLMASILATWALVPRRSVPRDSPTDAASLIA